MFFTSVNHNSPLMPKNSITLFILVQSTKIFSKAQLSGLRILCFILVVVPLYEVVAEFIVGVKLFH